VGFAPVTRFFFAHQRHWTLASVLG
jgi:hypothetical protein